MALEIRSAPALIGIDRTPSSLEMETRSARLEFRQKHAKVNIETEPARVEIDQYQCFAEAGLKNNFDFMKEITDRAKQQALEFVGKTASDGTRLAAIEKGGNPIVDISVRDAWPQHEFGLDTIPKSRPQYTVKGGVKLEPERNGEGTSNGVEGNFIPGNLNINYRPAVVNVYLRQQPSISIRYLGENIDAYR